MEKLERIEINGEFYRIYGDSAYEIAVQKELFEGTEEEWIASLKGNKGDKGDKPIKGKDYFTDGDVDEIVNEIVKQNGMAKIGNLTILANGWEGTESPYSQVVTVEGGITEHSQVDLTPSVEQLAIFHEKDLAFVTENEGGIVTVYAIGQKPANDYDIQVTITEVGGKNEKIIGVTVGTTLNPSKIIEKVVYPIRQDKSYYGANFSFNNLEIGQKYNAVDENGTLNVSNAKLNVSYLDPANGDSYQFDVFSKLENLDNYPSSFTFKVLGFDVVEGKRAIKFEYCGTEYNCQIHSIQIPTLKNIGLAWDGELYICDPLEEIKADLKNKISLGEAQTLIKEELGAVENELDAIIEIQNTLIGGEEE